MNELVSSDPVTQLARAVMEREQADCPVAHLFGPNLYIRTLFMPAGVIAIGHEQRFEQMNIMLTGKVAMFTETGDIVEVTAPKTFVGKAGRKIGFVIEDTIWQNVYSTSETDVDKLEEMFFNKDADFHFKQSELLAIESAQRVADRADYEALIAEMGYTQEMVDAEVNNVDDQIPAPQGASYRVCDSAIHGKGIFLEMSFGPGEVIGMARIGGKRTPLGRFTNHSASPNAKFVSTPSGDIVLVATSVIQGRKGGFQGDEVTVNYREALELTRGTKFKGE